MLTSDAQYQMTRRLKLNGELPPAPFGKLAAWIAWKFGVTVLDIHRIGATLDIVLEHKWEAAPLRDETRTSYDKATLHAIAAQYASLLADYNGYRLDPSTVSIVFSGFDGWAMRAASDRVTKVDLDRLKQRLNNPDLWTIVTRLDGATFFFYTDAQAQASEAQGLREKYAAEYARVVAAYDEFGYFAKTGVLVVFDSKENFVTRYKGSWWNYMH